MGAPSVYFVYAVPQDGFTTPADFNASASSYLRSLWNGTATGSGAGTLSATPDANGFYTATLTGVQIPTAVTVPATRAVMLTGGVGYSYNVRSSLPLTQTNLAAFPTAPATAAGLNANMPNRTGGLIVIAPNVQKVATNFSPRRAIVDDALCNKCHLELGTFTEEAFHAGQRNDGTTCAWCHTPNRSSSGWSADSEYFVHAIHGRAKRNPSNPFVPNPEFDFTWHAASPTDGFYTIGYPGVLKRCETCHLPNTFDFSGPASAASLPNRLYRTAVTGTLATLVPPPDPPAAPATPNPNAFQFAPAIMNGRVLAPRDTPFGSAFAVDANGAPVPPPAPPALGNTANLVISPIATVCSSCHTSSFAMAHIENEGGSIYRARGTPTVGAVPATLALAKQELCMACHGPVSAFGLSIAAVHALP
jgi:OmcA/MtrC family decaheme c-type cytochrome